jgi:hypothetical protein
MKFWFGIAVAVAVIFAGWQILAPEVTNIIFQDDLHDLAAQLDSRVGMAKPRTDEELRNLVIAKAAQREIELAPQQVTIRRSGPPEGPVFFIAVDYTVPINLVVYSFPRHFNPTSEGGRF